LQHNAIPLPKSSHKERIKANFDVFNFKISDNDMKKINSDRFFKRVFPDPKKGK
jgi:diketogulonate reductase-like aldo/keto reductase